MPYCSTSRISCSQPLSLRRRYIKVLSTEDVCYVTLFVGRRRPLMPGKWDTSTKRLVGENPEHFIRWLVPGAKFEGKAKARPLNLNKREIEVDTLYEIVSNGKPCLVLFEFQTYFDETMAQRMWEYNALATFSYNRPTYSCV